MYDITKLTASLAVFYGVSPASVRDVPAEGLQTGLRGTSKDGTAIQYGTACKSYIPGWAGEGVGVVGLT